MLSLSVYESMESSSDTTAVETYPSEGVLGHRTDPARRLVGDAVSNNALAGESLVKTLLGLPYEVLSLFLGAAFGLALSWLASEAIFFACFF